MPSTTSSSVSRLLASSTVITPSLPTLRMASARMRPTSASPLAEIVPTWAISSLEVTFLALALSSSTTALTAMSMPRFRSIGLAPAATDLAPSFTIAWASTVAVVVPSPATSEVLEATSRSICAPMFSNLSSSSISLATVTPSLVVRGAPKLFSMTTLRPLGPSVTFTALARMSTPRSIFSRASAAKRTSLAAIWLVLLRVFGDAARAIAAARDREGEQAGGSALEHAHDVGLLHDEELLAIDLDLGAGPFAEQHLVALLDVERREFAGFVACAGPHRDHFALLRLLGGGVGDYDTSGSLGFAADALDDDAVVKRTKLHARDCSGMDGAAAGDAAQG